MKVKNMGEERQSTYSKLYAYSRKNLKNSFLTGVVALVFAMIASLFNSAVLACIFSILSLILSGGEAISRTLKRSGKGKFDDSILVLIAVLVTFFLGKFVIAATAMAIYKLTQVLLMYLSGKLGVLMKDAAEVLPDYANLVDTDATIRRVSVSSLTRGMKIMVKTGEVVPADSTISDGFSEFDTSNVYLSDNPVSLSAGDKVLAGFINNGSSVTCEVLCDHDDSLVCDMRRLAAMAEKSSTKGEKRFLSIAKWYPLAVLALAVAVLLIGGFSGGMWTNAMLRASVLLIVASTGSYVIAAPLLSACAAWNLKKKGLAIASGDLIDEIADINCVAFEKNGILTDGVYQLTEVYTAEGIAEDDFLMIAANCIGGRQHPISKLLTKYKNQYIPAEDVIEFPGKGMECTIMGKAFLCGSEAFIKECGGELGELSGYNVYVTIDGSVMGALRVQDLLRQDTGEQIGNLRKTGVEKIVMLTSERKDAAEPAYLDCGADDYFAELSSYGRVETISTLKQEEDTTCAYIGDLTNGSQAMDEADVGIALVSKDDSGLEYSKAALLGDLKTIAEAIEIARLACGKIELHFYCATAVKIVLVLLALFGAVNVAAAIVIDALLTAVALLSAGDLMKK